MRDPAHPGRGGSREMSGAAHPRRTEPFTSVSGLCRSDTRYRRGLARGLPGLPSQRNRQPPALLPSPPGAAWPGHRQSADLGARSGRRYKGTGRRPARSPWWLPAGASAATPITRPAAMSGKPAGCPGDARMGGRCPADEMCTRSSAGSNTATARWPGRLARSADVAEGPAVADVRAGDLWASVRGPGRPSAVPARFSLSPGTWPRWPSFPMAAAVTACLADIRWRVRHNDQMPVISSSSRVHDVRPGSSAATSEYGQPGIICALLFPRP